MKELFHPQQWLIHCMLALQEKYGNISERLLLRERLKCNSFEWYLKNIYPELHVPEDREGWHGAVSVCLSDAVSEFCSWSHYYYFFDWWQILLWFIWDRKVSLFWIPVWNRSIRGETWHENNAAESEVAGLRRRLWNPFDWAQDCYYCDILWSLLFWNALQKMLGWLGAGFKIIMFWPRRCHSFVWSQAKIPLKIFA